MIPLIGFMIGAYIITRMVETINNKQTAGIVALCAFATVVIVIFCLGGLLLKSVDRPIDTLDLPSMPRMQGIPGQH